MNTCVLGALFLGLLGPGCEDSVAGGGDAHEAGPGDAAQLLDARPDPADAGPNGHVIEIPGTGIYDSFGFSNSGFIAAYAEYRGTEAYYMDVYYFDVTTGLETLVTDRPMGQKSPYVCSDQIVFDDAQFVPVEPNRKELFLYDIMIGTERRLTDSPYLKSAAVVNPEFAFYVADGACPDPYL